MSTLLMAAVLAAVAADQPGERAAAGAMPNVQGKWLIVYAEEGGRRMNSWEQRVATIKDDTMTYERDGKEQAMHLTFGPHQTLKASAGKSAENTAGTGQGVYIAAQDYLCLSLASGNFTGGERGGAGAAGAAGAGQGQGHGTSSGKFILILRRQR
jgi:hypothetical protein